MKLNSCAFGRRNMSLWLFQTPSIYWLLFMKHLQLKESLQENYLISMRNGVQYPRSIYGVNIYDKEFLTTCVMHLCIESIRSLWHAIPPLFVILFEGLPRGEYHLAISRIDTEIYSLRVSILKSGPIINKNFEGHKHLARHWWPSLGIGKSDSRTNHGQSWFYKSTVSLDAPHLNAWVELEDWVVKISFNWKQCTIYEWYGLSQTKVCASDSLHVHTIRVVSGSFPFCSSWIWPMHVPQLSCDCWMKTYEQKGPWMSPGWRKVFRSTFILTYYSIHWISPIFVE